MIGFMYLVNQLLGFGSYFSGKIKLLLPLILPFLPLLLRLHLLLLQLLPSLPLALTTTSAMFTHYLYHQPLLLVTTTTTTLLLSILVLSYYYHSSTISISTATTVAGVTCTIFTFTAIVPTGTNSTASIAIAADTNSTASIAIAVNDYHYYYVVQRILWFTCTILCEAQQNFLFVKIKLNKKMDNRYFNSTTTATTTTDAVFYYYYYYTMTEFTSLHQLSTQVHLFHARYLKMHSSCLLQMYVVERVQLDYASRK